MVQQRQQLPSENLLHDDTGMAMGSGSPLVATEEQRATETRVTSPGKDAWRRFRRNWAAIISFSVILLMIFIAAFAPFLHTLSPFNQDYGYLDGAPNGHYWFGTDGLGRDIFARLMFGLRIPLIVGIVGAVITTLIGSLLGVLSGYAGGIVDSFLSRLTDLIFAFPAFLLALLVIELFGPALDPYFGGAGRVIVLVVVFAIVGWPALMRFVRSLTLSLKEQQFVEAARTSGTSSWKILSRHLLPNMYGLILVQASFLVVNFVYTEAVLSIFGLGVTPPNPDLGTMLFQGAERLDYSYWEAIFPSIFLTIIILTFTFVGDGVRDAVDPRGND